jgi:hypothetical protein
MGSGVILFGELLRVEEGGGCKELEDSKLQVIQGGSTSSYSVSRNAYLRTWRKSASFEKLQPCANVGLRAWGRSSGLWFVSIRHFQKADLHQIKRGFTDRLRAFEESSSTVIMHQCCYSFLHARGSITDRHVDLKIGYQHHLLSGTSTTPHDYE